MKRQTLLFPFVGWLLLFMVGSPPYQAATTKSLPQVMATAVAVLPVIDGKLDERAWKLRSVPLKPIISKPNNKVSYCLLWDYNYLYISVKVTDKELVNDSTSSVDDDSVEIYLDADYNRGTSYDVHDRQFVKGWDDKELWEKSGNTDEVLHAWGTVRGGYCIEMAIPWDSLEVTPADGKILGFDIGINDDEDGDGRDSQGLWAGTNDNWTNTSGFGVCKLLIPSGVTPAPKKAPLPDIVIYGDELASGWENASNNAIVDYMVTDPVREGKYATSAIYTKGLAWLAFSTAKPLSTEGYSTITFWVHGGADKDKDCALYVKDASGSMKRVPYTANAGSWKEVTIPFSTLGDPQTIIEIGFQEFSAAPQTAVFYDNIRLVQRKAATAKLVDAGPITDEIYMLWFRDGSYKHNRSNTMVAEKTPLDLKKAIMPTVYKLTSPDDPDFTIGVNPLRVGRKSKASDFQGFGSAGHFKDHQIFLQFPKKMKPGKHYVLSMGPLGGEQKFAYDPFAQRCEAIHTNQYGYAPQSTAKYAYISMMMGDMKGLELDDRKDTKFHVVKESDNKIVFTGTIAKRKDLETGGPDFYPEYRPAQENWFKSQYISYTMADVWECNFSAYQGEPGYTGKYKIVIEGMGSSFPFRIDRDVFFDAWKDCMHGIYVQRCGIPLESKYTEWPREACHLVEMHQTKTPGINGEEAPAPTTGEVYTHIWGGYHDAADNDKWINHFDVTRNLCLAYELRPGIFKDGDLNIPEAGNGIPDILDEAAWNIAFFLRMQQEDGGVRGTCWEANGKWYVGPAEADVSFYFAASASQLAYCLKIAGVEKIIGPYYQDVNLSRENLLVKAKAAYDWAIAQGANDHYAHAWMFKATGDKKYEEAFKKDNPITTATTPLFPEVEGHIPYNFQNPVLVYVTTDLENMDREYRDTLRQAFINWSIHDRLEPSQDLRPFRQGWHRRMPPLIGNQTAPEVMLQSVVFFGLGGGREWLDTIYSSLDYALGGNEMNMCFMAQCGYRFPKEIMHQTTWSYNDPKGCARGIIPYGAFPILSLATENNIHNMGFGAVTCYPDYKEWGLYELFFENRFCALTNEFTVNQTNAQAALGYALLKDGGPN